MGDYYLEGGFLFGQGTEPTHLSAEEQGDGRKGLFLSMMCAVAFNEVQCQTVLSVCSRGGEISTWHLPHVPSSRMEFPFP